MTTAFLRTGFIAIWGLFMLAGCGSHDGGVRESAADKQVRDEVELAVRAIIDADNRGDLPKALDCYTDEVIWIPPNAEPVEPNDVLT